MPRPGPPGTAAPRGRPQPERSPSRLWPRGEAAAPSEPHPHLAAARSGPSCARHGQHPPRRIPLSAGDATSHERLRAGRAPECAGHEAVRARSRRDPWSESSLSATIQPARPANMAARRRRGDRDGGVRGARGRENVRALLVRGHPLEPGGFNCATLWQRATPHAVGHRAKGPIRRPRGDREKGTNSAAAARPNTVATRKERGPWR